MDSISCEFDAEQLFRVLTMATASRLRSRGYAGESAMIFAEAIESIWESSKKEVQSRASATLTSARKNGASDQDYAALAIAEFAIAGVDIADRAIRERVSFN